MSILDLIRAPAKNAEALRAKLAQLKAADPEAGIPTLVAEREQALLVGDDNALDRIDAERMVRRRDVERRPLAIAAVEKELAAAEAAELDAERKKARKLAETAKKRMPAGMAPTARSVLARVSRVYQRTPRA